MAYFVILYLFLLLLLLLYSFILWYHVKKFSLPNDPMPQMAYRGYLIFTILLLAASNLIAFFLYFGVL